MTYPADIASNTLPKYRFKLVNSKTSEYKILTAEPIGWNDGTLEIERILKVGGVFSKFSTNALVFIKEGAKFIRDIWEEYEFNGECELHIYWFKLSTRTYVEFPNYFALDFTTIKPRVKVGEISIGVEIEAINSGVANKLKNRESTNVDLTKLKSLGGLDIIDYGTGDPSDFLPVMPNEVFFENSSTSKIGILESSIRSELPRKSGSITYTSIPLTILSSDFTELQSVPHVVRVETLAGLTPFLLNAVEAYYGSFSYDITIDVVDKDADDPWEILLIETDSSNNLVNEWSIATLGSSLGTTDHTYTGIINLTLSSIGNNLIFAVRVSDEPDIEAYVTHAWAKFHSIELNVVSRWLESFPLYNAFERVLQHCLDVQFPFYSEYLSYNTPYTIQYDLDGNVYPARTGEQLNYFNLFTGLGIRGAKNGDENNPFSLNFAKLFNSSSAILNLGYTIVDIAGFTRVRVEEYSWFFDDTVVLDLSSRITKYDIETEAMPELAYQKIKTGYQNFDYEEVNGRGEYNTLHERTTILNTNSEFDNVSDLRADSVKINSLFDKYIDENGTTDEQGDNDIFIIKTQSYAGGWKVETIENIAIENGTSFFAPENSFNLYCTPTRNLIRNGNKIKAALIKYPESVIKYQTSEKLQTLETTGEGYTIVENQDILVDDLEDPIFKPIKHTIDVEFTFSDLVTLQSNLYGLIKFSSTIQGYLLNLKKKNNEDKATISIIEKYA